MRPGHRGGLVLAVEVLVGADGAPGLGLDADADGRRRRHAGGPPQVHVRVLARAHRVPPVRRVGRRDLAARVLETFIFLEETGTVSQVLRSSDLSLFDKVLRCDVIRTPELLNHGHVIEDADLRVGRGD